MAVTKYPTNLLKSGIDDHEKRIVTLERKTDVHDERLKDLRTDVDKICSVTDELQKVVIASGQAINLGKWIVGLFGASVIALIWSLITGEATLLFK